MVVIRLARVGSKKRPFYHVVAIDRRHSRNSGNYIERLGYFNPVARGGEIRLHLDHDRITHWVSLGAQPSDRVTCLVAESGKVAAGLPSTAQKRKIKQTDKKAKVKAQAASAASAAKKEQEKEQKQKQAQEEAQEKVQEKVQNAEKSTDAAAE